MDTGATSWDNPAELESQLEPALPTSPSRALSPEPLEMVASPSGTPSRTPSGRGAAASPPARGSVDEALEKLASRDAAEAGRLGELRSAVQVCFGTMNPAFDAHPRRAAQNERDSLRFHPVGLTQEGPPGAQIPTHTTTSTPPLS